MNYITFIPEKDIEKEALQQIQNTASMPIIFKHVAVMPDCHFGMGATVGTVLATKDAVIPAAVGVDIGCGMIAVETPLTQSQLPEDLISIRKGIERRIPMSAGKYNQKITEFAQRRIDELEGEAEKYIKFDNSWREQLGTLGGGNHFIELAIDERGMVWVLLHSGSRGVGNRIAQHYIKIAKQNCSDMHIDLPDPDLAYLVPSKNIPGFSEYIHDLHWAQQFALLNREEMMDRVMTELSYQIYNEDGHQKELEKQRINCHHNFTQVENHFGQNVFITRKGAIEASKGKMALIPGSMGTRSYIVEGLGNQMSFNSAPHGAGRRMSRKKAKQRFTMDDLKKSMGDVVFRESEKLIDEIPQAYKDIDKVMENAKELVTIKHTLKQILNVKGD